MVALCRDQPQTWGCLPRAPAAGIEVWGLRARKCKRLRKFGGGYDFSGGGGLATVPGEGTLLVADCSQGCVDQLNPAGTRLE